MKLKIIAYAATICISLATMAQDMLKGNASYYSDKLHGRKMSNGDPYHRDSMTCAHLKYPLGTMLKVRNPINNKEVIVKVTDRGPHTKRFILDLSRAAAKELDIIRSGFSQVEITPYHKNEIPYRPEVEEEEIPELDLQYSVAATYPEPAWQSDTVRATAPKGQQHADSQQKQGKPESASSPSTHKPSATKPATPDSLKASPSQPDTAAQRSSYSAQPAAKKTRRG